MSFEFRIRNPKLETRDREQVKGVSNGFYRQCGSAPV